MTFNTYWDMTEKERAALTEQDVERFLDAELMTKGVLRPAPLELLTEPALPEPDVEIFVVKSRGFQRLDVAFHTAEAARTCLERCLVLETSYIGGHTVYHVNPLREPTIENQRIHSTMAVEQARSSFEKQAAVKTENDRRRRAHDEETKHQEEALRGLWDDWHQCRARGVEMERVWTTFREYSKIAGDDETARRFLARAFDVAKLKAAEDWHGVRFRPQPEIAEAPECRDIDASAGVQF